MGFSFLKSKLKLLDYYQPQILSSSQRLIDKAIADGFKPSYQFPSPSSRSLTSSTTITRYRDLFSTCFARFNRVNASALIVRGVRLYSSNANRYPLVPLKTVNRSIIPHQKNWIVKLVKNSSLKKELLEFAKANKMLTVGLLSMIVFGSIERVPYSNRIHLVFRSDRLERYIGAFLWEDQKRYHRGDKYELQNRNRIMDPKNPEAIRVQKIFNRILGAMHDGLGLKHGHMVSQKDLGLRRRDEQVGFRKMVNVLVDSEKSFHSRGKVKNRRGSRFGLKYGTKHLEGLNWEIMFIDDYKENAFYIPTGKIGVHGKSFKGRSEEEIATTIAHEIGHALGRHSGELLIRVLWYLILFRHEGDANVYGRGLFLKMIENFFSRRRELEADHIGLMLMASAGYDPRVAPKVCSRFGSKSSIHSTHPAGTKRAEKLRRKEVMGKAVAIYEQVKAGKSVSFI